jgi:hypothetical protein
MNNNSRINCRICRHFFVTWDKKHPYGCKAIGFKGKIIPSMVVLKNSGQKCQLFDPKPPKK